MQNHQIPPTILDGGDSCLLRSLKWEGLSYKARSDAKLVLEKSHGLGPLVPKTFTLDSTRGIFTKNL
jgi:hypothetical protein